jgi:tRNA(Arg) A34 adenosine deaminase TadA
VTDDFQARVQRHVERLEALSCREIERQVAEARIAWFQRKRPESGDRPSPRRAYELLFLDYMGLSPDDLPVVSETETEIVWLSRNRCPTLEACQLLGWDTRRVCRAAFEKSTQAFVSQLDPQLRFLRSYTEIRPHADHCRERIVRVDFEAMVSLALEEARLSKQTGNKGYGAVVALGNCILGRAHDTAATKGDPSLHAEVNAIRQAAHTLDDPNLSGAILFSTCEPCPMCASLAVWANLTTIVYGASIAETAQMGQSRILVSAQEIVDRSPAMVEVIGGVLREMCASLYQDGQRSAR